MPGGVQDSTQNLQPNAAWSHPRSKWGEPEGKGAQRVTGPLRVREMGVWPQPATQG